MNSKNKARPSRANGATRTSVPVSGATLDLLLERAAEVRTQAYAPYSRYKVGAAVLGKSGRIYTGANVENAAYGLTMCAERNAIFHAVAEGEREFLAMGVVTTSGGSPCGACRQVLSEFASPDTPVIMASARGGRKRMFTIGELLKDGFTPRELGTRQRR